MPNYPGAANSNTLSPTTPTPLGRGESVYLFGVLAAGATQLPVNPTNVVGENPAAPQASIAINVGDYQEQGPAPGVSFEGFFDGGAPGAFEVDIQEADTDCDNAYITPTNAAYTITAVTANNRFRVDLVPTGGRFMRALLKTRTNNVTLQLKATRLQ